MRIINISDKLQTILLIVFILAVGLLIANINQTGLEALADYCANTEPENVLVQFKTVCGVE
ncbi:hypothetical protein FACS1894103_7400 [Campylobacterota bacterium]|nr:hypothetical protein FACS1894103_7400 [Campylobacterota bacterium]